MIPKIRLVALRDFSGPEGAKGGEKKGKVFAGEDFMTTLKRALYLQRRGLAYTPKGHRVKLHDKTLYGLDRFSIEEIVDLVRKEKISKSEALELDRRGRTRKTLGFRLRYVRDQECP